ncbi:unnamed protein product [Clonostachys rosea]|uniref:SMP-30/Gluconolactonase/LRE-like region domain-containing protein n=1 Tax=Bionectria ochroleuca TaxID=29856 RepID=A0ABY6TR65_BIOOC|nr:unnamed protein product [Clonostachys rosea]
METFKISEAHQPYLDLKCGLSEGPFWEREDNVLRFVDIVNKKVYRVNLDQGPSSLKEISYDDSVSVTAELEGAKDSFLFGGKYGIGFDKKSGGEPKIIQRYWSEEEEKDRKPKKMRANDGAVDSKGRFWVSAICDPAETSFKPEGALFRLDPDGQFHRILNGVTIGNGISWSEDEKIMYFTDTGDRSIFAYDFDKETGNISNKRVFFLAEEGTGPDGHTRDEAGNFWIALWGSWKVIRVSPEGKITGEVHVPTRCPTAVAFAGEDIYITSESEHEPEKYPESVKYSGSIFKCHVGTRGRPTFAAKLKV